MNKQKFLDFVRIVRPADFIFLTFAGIINAVGVTLFLTPATLYDGGFSGTSILLGNVTPLSMSLWLLILNVPFFLFGLKRMGVVFILHSLYAVGIYSLFSFLFQSVFGLDFSAGSPIAGADMLLSALFGGVISGVGSGLTIRFGGAIDGVEVLAVVFAKRIGMTVGSFVMSYNVILYIIAGIVTRDWIAPLYSIVAYTVGLKAVDFVIDGFDKAKSAFIITERHNEVADMLSKEFGRGVTTLDAEGYYSHTPKTVLYCVVNRFERALLRRQPLRDRKTQSHRHRDRSFRVPRHQRCHRLPREQFEVREPHTPPYLPRDRGKRTGGSFGRGCPRDDSGRPLSRRRPFGRRGGVCRAGTRSLGRSLARNERTRLLAGYRDIARNERTRSARRR